VLVADFSFDSDTLSVDPIGANPTVDPSAIVPNLESVALSGLDEMDILVAVDLAQNDVTDRQVVKIHRHNGAELSRLNLPAHGIPTRAKLYRVALS
jgi:hypothetical protein